MKDKLHKLAKYIANMAYAAQVHNQTFEHFGQLVELELQRQLPKLIEREVCERLAKSANEFTKEQADDR